MSGSTHVRVVLALVLAVTLAGCGAVNVPFVDDDGDEDDRAEQISADAIAEMQSVSAYNFTMRNVVEFGENELNMSADGVVNHSSERLFMEAVLAVETNTTRSKDFSEVYVTDDTLCRNTNPDVAGSEWEVSDNVSSWNQGLSLSAQQEILNASGTEATLLENQTLRGEDVYVVQISPDPQTLKRVVANESDVDFSNVAVRNATITQYVAQDDKRLLRSEMQIEYVVDGRKATMDLTMRYSSFGDVPSIELPEDAKRSGCGGE